MTRNEAKTIIRKEYLCVDRDCDIERSCGKCDLMMPSKEPILEAYKLAIKALEQEPTEWVPVSEELPQRGKQVLCCNESGSVFTSAITYVEKHEDGSKYVCFGKHYNVIAWMPLPPCYEPQESEDT